MLPVLLGVCTHEFSSRRGPWATEDADPATLLPKTTDRLTLSSCLSACQPAYPLAHRVCAAASRHIALTEGAKGHRQRPDSRRPKCRGRLRRAPLSSAAAQQRTGGTYRLGQTVHRLQL